MTNYTSSKLSNMSTYEFNSIGVILFGNSWKRDLTRALSLSVNSRTVDKISTQQRSISLGIETDLLNLLKAKITSLSKAVKYLEAGEKIPVIKEDLSLLSFDLDGIYPINVFEEHSPHSETGVIIPNATLNLPHFDYEFHSLIISQAAEEAFEKEDKTILLSTINKYFDLKGFPEFLVNTK